VIQRGDTLWDLSQKFLNNPWYWPKIWSLNPYIENPHWIYPGNKLKVQGGQGGAPAQVEAQAGAEQPAEAGAAPVEAALDASDDPLAPSPQPGADLAVTPSANEAAAARRSVTASGRLSFTPPSLMTVRASGLVSEAEIDNAGTLDSSFEEKGMLAPFDTAYVRFRQAGAARIGEKVLIFRAMDPIVHPVTHQVVASRTKTVGEAKVIAAAGEVLTVQVTRTWEEIERGDLVRPWSEQMRRLIPKPNGRQVDGTILGAVNEALTTLGQAHEVFIDRGKADGVEEGNTFSVLRNGDGLTLKSAALGSADYTAGEAGEAANKLENPDESVALLMVVDVRDNVSTAIVVRAVKEIETGDRVSMRPSGSGGF
jgi:hypothetical protein